MHGAALIAGTVCVLGWIYLLLAHGGFWRMPQLPERVSPADAGLVAVIIPARNEADVIGESLRSLLRQSYAGPIHIFVVDDGSSDNTAAVARQAATSSGRQEVLTVIEGNPLPPNWSGKLWAVEQGIQAALLLQPQFLLLTDADVQHSRENITTVVAVAQRESYDLVSFMVRLHCRNLAENLLIPAFVFFFFMLYPPAWICDPRRDTAGAAGGCMLIRPAALEIAGGIAAIRSEIIDDCALAAAVKRSHGKVWLGLTSDTRSLREYRSFGEIERMVARTAFNQLRHSAWRLVGALAGMALMYLLPLTLLLSGSGLLAAVGTLSYLLMFIAYLPVVRFYRLSVPWALTLPFGAVFYMCATVHSAVKYWSGRGGEWKGRAQDIVSNG